ncbi:MAG: hypothetical protein IT318_01295 [Anaerolineales bacterium]|nr:hypothetical protein [Anaerolineales bacterium]
MTELAPRASTTPIPATPAGHMRRGDWGLRLLSRLRLSPAAFGALVAAYVAAQGGLLPWLLGAWRAPGLALDARRDWPYFVIGLVALPLQCAYYAWQPRSIQNVYDAFARRPGMAGAAQARAAELVRPLAWPVWQWAALGLGLWQVVAWLEQLGRMQAATWMTAHPLLTFSAQPLRFLAFYTLALILGRQVIVMIGLNRFFAEHKVEIAPLHPDQAGGLRMLGDYVLQSGFLVAVIGLNVSMTALRGKLAPEFLTSQYYFEVALFCLLGPAVLVLPLWTVHRRMLAARAALLAEISEQFDQEYRALLDGLRRNELQAAGVARLEAVQKVYAITAAAPSWPFNVDILSKFSIAVLLPLLAPLIADYVVNRLLR